MGKPRMIRFHLDILENDIMEVDSITDKKGITRSDAIRRAIKWYILISKYLEDGDCELCVRSRENPVDIRVVSSPIV